jgi:hypothetical protein
MDQNKPITKAIKLIQSYLANSNSYQAEKLYKNLKSNKTEFLRLLSIYSQVNYKNFFLNIFVLFK